MFDNLVNSAYGNLITSLLYVLWNSHVDDGFEKQLICKAYAYCFYF